jgi:hypothetical protein
MQTTYHLINEASAELIFALRNTGAADQPASVAVDCVSELGGKDNPNQRIHQLEYGTGFLVKGDRHEFYVIVHNGEMTTDVDAFWFGPSSQRDSNRWGQTTSSIFVGQESAFAFSWQNRLVRARGSLQLTVVFRFGPTTPPVLNVTAQPSQSVERFGSIRFTGSVSGAYPSNVWLFVDSGTNGKVMLHNHVRGSFRVDFGLTPLHLVNGRHLFSVFAVDQLGGISQSSSWSINVVGPAMTPASTRSAARPTESPVPGLVIQYTTAVSGTNFDIFGLDDGVKVPTTVDDRGYETVVKVGEKIGYLVSGRPQTISDVTVSTWLLPHGQDIEVVFNVMNDANEDRTVSLAVSADIWVGGSTMTDLILLSYMSGFQMQTPVYTYSFVGRYAPLVTDIDTFWFGRTNRRHECLWDQVWDPLLGQNRSAIAFSWQNRKIGAHKGATYSAVFWFGEIAATPTMSLSSSLPPSVYEPGLLTFSGQVVDGTPGSVLRLNVLVDSRVAITIMSDLRSGTDFTASTKLSEYGIEPGAHLLDVFVTNHHGVSSDTVTINVTLLSFITDIHLDPNSETIVSSHSNPVRISGEGVLRGEDGDLSLAVVNITRGAIVSSNQLTLTNELVMTGASRLQPIGEDNQIFISDGIEVVFIGVGRDLPGIDLGAVGRYYSSVPSKFRVVLNKNAFPTRDDVSAFYVPLVVAYTLSACDRWLGVSVVEPDWFEFLCDPSRDAFVAEDEKRTLVLMGRRGGLKSALVLVLALIVSLVVITVAIVTLNWLNRKREPVSDSVSSQDGPFTNTSQKLMS